MPSWLRTQGGIVRNHYSGWVGELPLRLFGAVMVGFILWVCYDLFVRSEPGPDPLWFLDVPSAILRLIICIGLGTMGVLMVLKPQWMYERYWEPHLVGFKPKIGGEPKDVRDHVGMPFFISLIRTLGFVIVALAFFLAWALF